MKLNLCGILLFSILFFPSCNRSGRSFTAGFLVHTLQDERWAIERDAFTAKAKELGGKVIFENAEQDERNQYHLAKKMISEGIDVLVIVPVNSKTAASISRLCSENGVKLIAYDIIVENSPLDLYISFDNEKVGEIMAKYAIEHKPTGNYVLLWGDSDMKVTHWIREGQMKILEPYIKSGQINVVYKTYVESWSNINSEHLMGKVIDVYGDKIDAIIASADGIAQGVVDAYAKESGLKVPLLTGQDASHAALEYIKEGKQSMTIRKSFKDLAERAAVCASELASGKKIKPDLMLSNGYAEIPSILLPPSLVDINNLQ
jgi:D-xylose transport system substrate-binding protein